MSDKKETGQAPHPVPVDTGEPSLLETATASAESEGIPSDVADIGSSFCNGFYVTVTSGLVRIAFAEVLDGHHPRYRWSVVMPLEDAHELARVIDQLIGDYQNRLIGAPEPEETGEFDEETGEYK